MSGGNRLSTAAAAVLLLAAISALASDLGVLAKSRAGEKDPTATSAERSVPQSAEASIAGTLQLTGDIPPLSPIPVRMGIRSRLVELESVAKTQNVVKLPDESFLVSKEGYLANAIVYLTKPPTGYVASPPPTEPFVLSNDALRFSPQVAVMRAGQSLMLQNNSNESANFRCDALRNNGFNMLVGIGDQVRMAPDQIRSAEVSPMTIQTTIQPWKRWARLLPLDHPFAAVTDANGRFDITGLPPGEHHFIVWHERAGYLDKKLTITAKPGETTTVTLKYDIARFEPAMFDDGRSVQWVKGGDGWSVGVGWTSHRSEFTGRNADSVPHFQCMVRNETGQPLKISVPESINWDFGMQADRQLNVRLHDRGESIVTLAARETRVLDVPNPKLNLNGIESGYWQVRFATPFRGSDVFIDLWLDAPPPAWIANQSLELQNAVQHPNDEFKDVRWGQALQGLRFGVRMKADPNDSLLHDARRRGRLRVAWPENEVVKLGPEFFLWNTTTAEIEISMLHHSPSDWSHRISQNNGPDISPMDELGGPKFEVKHRIKPGGVLTLGVGALNIRPSESDAKPVIGTIKLPPNECGYWSFLNLHRTDQPHLSLHLRSGMIRLIDSQIRDENRRF